MFSIRPLSQNTKIIILITLWCTLNRIILFGNPLIDIDENYYMFGGGIMLHGGIPYVDFWDRKPVLLFLIYSFFHIFGEYRYIACSIGSLISVIVTSYLIYKISSKFVSKIPNILSALFYAPLINGLGGEGGQSEVFYTTLVVWSLNILLKNYNKKENIFLTGTMTMAILGIAIQIKYTVIFEGMAIGSMYLFFYYRLYNSIKSTILIGLFWILTALLPTILVGTFFYTVGHGSEWFFANFISQFKTLPAGIHKSILLKISISFLPIILSFLITYKKHSLPSPIAIPLFWFLGSAIGIIIFNNYSAPHYIIPLCAPISVLSGFAYSSQITKYILISSLVLTTVKSQKWIIHHLSTYSNRSTFKTLISSMTDKNACLFNFNMSTSYYDETRWCHLTTHPFPNHLWENKEKFATGIQQSTEISKIMLQKPKYILYETYEKDPNYYKFINKNVNDTFNNYLTKYHIIQEVIYPDKSKDILYEIN